MDRTQEVVDIILGEFAAMNIGPNGTLPTQTIRFRVNSGTIPWSDVHASLEWAVADGLLLFSPGGIAGLGTLTLTQAGYERSRS